MGGYEIRLHHGVLPIKIGSGTELNRTVTCKELKAVANNMYKTCAPCEEDFRGLGLTIGQTSKTPKNGYVNGCLPPVVWDKKIPDTELNKFKKVVEDKYNLHLGSYWDFQRWSVENYENFWEEIWNYFGVITSRPYDKVVVKTGDGLLDYEWFPGARFNYAENLLRIRDDRVALIYYDETGYEESVTYAELFEEVKLYSAAFRKHGLQIGDTVACYMSNRNEAIFAMLATTSIGAIWGGPTPYYGSRASANIIRKMEAKFLITVDHHLDMGKDYNLIENIPIIANSCPSLEKIIIIPSKNETKTKGIAHIRNSYYLEDFLNSGRNPDGTVPDIIFEQLPFSHPVCVHFTSGTTGLPKAPVHSAGVMISHFKNIALHYNLRSGDVALSLYPMGWTLWGRAIPCIALGVKLLLYCGSPYVVKDGRNIWDIFSQYKVKYAYFVTSILDRLEKFQIVPRPELNLEHYQVQLTGGSPAKMQNFHFIHNKVKKDVFVGSQYGTTESFGCISGFDLNLPSYAGEIQAPALGMDLRCVDKNGCFVIGERGEAVIASPAPNFPLYLWKDDNNSMLKNIYLTKYPEFWYHNDDCWVNPKTKGLIIIGRSDDTLIQNGDRFGPGDVYFAIHEMEEILDYICVNQSRSDGDSRAVLFVKLMQDCKFTPELKEKISKTIERELSVDCVPNVILEAPDIPYNLNNKRMERVVRQIVATNEVPQVNNIKNPDCLKFFGNIPELVNYDK